MRILVAYYSKSGKTGQLAEAIKKELTAGGHFVDVEIIKPQKEHNFWKWWFLRIIKNRCAIQPLTIRNVSKYDAICLGSPNWNKLALPLAEYLEQVKGLKYKNVGFFATTAFIPQIDWYILSAYLFDFFSFRSIAKKDARIIDSILLSSVFKKWSISSQYGIKTIKNFCDKITSPIISLKDYFLKQKETDSARSAVMVFLVFLLIFSILQALSLFFEAAFLDWNEYFSLFVIVFLAYFTILTMLANKVFIFLGKYLASITFVAIFTLANMFLTFPLEKQVVIGYVYIFILISFFYDRKAVIFNAFITILGYFYLFFNSPLNNKLLFDPFWDIIFILLGVVITIYIAQSLRNQYVKLLEAQDEAEISRDVLEIKVTTRTRELKELAEGLDGQIQERTKELKQKIDELERFNKLMVGREIKMIELKKEIESLRKETKNK